MRPLLEATVVDIRAWANISDTYAKKRVVARVIASAAWDAKFRQYIEIFTARRREFQSALSIYAGTVANNAIESVEQKYVRLLL